MSAEWLNRYVALEREDTYGVEPGVLTAIAIADAGSGGDNSASGTWTMTSSGGGKGAFGTCTTTSGGALATIVITEGGQGYVNGDTFTYVFANIGSLAGTLDLTETISTTAASAVNDSNGLTYGEVDDESFAQTFELLARNDMSRQVASKAVTNTQYGEGSINLAVQPDDFMGKLLHSFLPATEVGPKSVKSVTAGGTNTGYTQGVYTLVQANAVTSDEAAVIRATVGSDGKVGDIYVVNPGKNYSSAPTFNPSFGNGSNATLTVAMGATREHVFNEPTLSTHAYPSYTVRVGRGNKEHTFTGMVASKLSMSANLNEYVMASVDFVGKNEETPSTLVTNVPFAGLAVDALHFADAEVFFQDNQNKTVKVQQISFEININRDLDSAYAVGNRSFTRAPPTQTREITGTMEFNEVIYSDIDGYINEPTYTQLTGSSVHKIQPGSGKDAIRIRFASEDGNDSLEFKFFNVRFEAPQASVSGRDANRMSVAFQAFYDATADGAGKAIEARLIGSGSHVRNTAYDA